MNPQAKTLAGIEDALGQIGEALYPFCGTAPKGPDGEYVYSVVEAQVLVALAIRDQAQATRDVAAALKDIAIAIHASSL